MKRPTLFALVDCNNFYASCERVFDPSLENQPVAVLSNNDGCIIARSNEVKALGIPMGAPMFKYKDKLKAHKVRVFSSNYTLYGDMSGRVMGVLADSVPDIEIYSIDEAFIDLSSYTTHHDVEELAQELRAKVKQWTGIPVSIGIGNTKTLAKLANRIAKKSRAGVFRLDSSSDPHQHNLLLGQIDVGDVWGVGRAHSKSLPKIGINTALDLKNSNAEAMRQRYSVVMMRTVKELQGYSCIPLEDAPAPKKATAVTRSFGKAVTTKKELIEAVSTYASRGGEKLRKAHQAAMIIQVFWHTGRFDPENPCQYWSYTIDLREHTSDSRVLVKAVVEKVHQHYEPGHKLKKAGIMLMNLVPNNQIQTSLFSAIENNQESSKLMSAMDAINAKFGKETIKLASSGIERKWRLKAEKRSPRYTTVWDELPIVKAVDMSCFA